MKEFLKKFYLFLIFANLFHYGKIWGSEGRTLKRKHQKITAGDQPETDIVLRETDLNDLHRLFGFSHIDKENRAPNCYSTPEKFYRRQPTQDENQCIDTPERRHIVNLVKNLPNTPDGIDSKKFRRQQIDNADSLEKKIASRLRRYLKENHIDLKFFSKDDQDRWFRLYEIITENATKSRRLETDTLNSFGLENNNRSGRVIIQGINDNESYSIPDGVGYDDSGKCVVVEHKNKNSKTKNGRRLCNSNQFRKQADYASNQNGRHIILITSKCNPLQENCIVPSEPLAAQSELRFICTETGDIFRWINRSWQPVLNLYIKVEDI